MEFSDNFSMWFQYNLNKQKNSNSLKFTLSIEIAYKRFYVKYFEDLWNALEASTGYLTSRALM